MKRYDRLSQLNIKKPCSANWDEMTGDEARRYCGHCRKHVHNLSELPADEAEALLNTGSVCVRFRRDDRGRVITKNALIAGAALLAIGCETQEPLTGDVAMPKPTNTEVGTLESAPPLTGTPAPPVVQGKPGNVSIGKIPRREPELSMGFAPAPIELGAAGPPDHRGDVQVKKTTK